MMLTPTTQDAQPAMRAWFDAWPVAIERSRPGPPQFALTFRCGG
jgi:hypothetical protein